MNNATKLSLGGLAVVFAILPGPLSFIGAAIAGAHFGLVGWIVSAIVLVLITVVGIYRYKNRDQTLDNTD